MTYVGYLNALVRKLLAGRAPFVLYGQNIAAGSRLAGLTAGLESRDGLKVINTPNCENALVGMGFGLMLEGVDSAFFMKQQDFLLLSTDHLVNTYNMVRLYPPRASFSIVAAVVDSGFEGPQSRLNNLGDFCSMARIPAYTVSNRHDADAIFGRHLVAPGFRIIAVSQRLLRHEIEAVEGPVECFGDGALFRYASGPDATIVCFNLAFPQGRRLARQMAEKGMRASLFSVNGLLIDDWTPILDDVAATLRLVVLDDSRSTNRLSHQLQLAIWRAALPATVVVRERAPTEAAIPPNPDEFALDGNDVLRALGATSVKAQPTLRLKAT
ncbi:MAG: hypothetical protein ACT4P2_05830 [Pseudomonadota bacterium]